MRSIVSSFSHISCLCLTELCEDSAARGTPCCAEQQYGSQRPETPTNIQRARQKSFDTAIWGNMARERGQYVLRRAHMPDNSWFASTEHDGLTTLIVATVSSTPRSQYHANNIASDDHGAAH